MKNIDQEPVEDMSSTQVIASPRIKLKDKAGRGGVVFNLKKDFGFIPDRMIVQKVHGQSNTIVVSAVLTPEMLKKEALGKLKDVETVSGEPVVTDEKVKEAVERVSGNAKPNAEVGKPKAK